MGGLRLAMTVVLYLAGAACAEAASFPCDSPLLGPTEVAICRDPQLSKLDEETARKLQTLLSRLSYGQYLGLRYWQSRRVEARELCGPDRTCLLAHYRLQGRTLDGLRQCLDRGGGRRTCWRTIVGNGGSAALPPR